ncbi:MAG: DUF6438 domain-containing protein [Chloroflexota bacterium]
MSNTHRSFGRYFVQISFFVLLLAASLFSPANRFDWAIRWIFIAITAFSQIGIALILITRNLELMNERVGSKGKRDLFGVPAGVMVLQNAWAKVLNFFFYGVQLFSCVTLAACSISIPFMQSAPAYPDLLISMERNGCFGTCPSYKLTIYADGTVDYEGFSYVKIEGKRKSKIDADQIEELVALIKNVDFFSFEEKYVAPASDLPSIRLSVTLDGQTKSVWHYGSLSCESGLVRIDSAPQELCELERGIGKVVNSDQWVTVSPFFVSIQP